MSGDAIDPTNANVNPAHIDRLRQQNRARLDAISEEQRRRKRARQQGGD
jgi:hypothetical protein